MSLLSRLNLRSVLGGAGWLAFAQAFTMACGLAATAVWARFMPVEVFGEFRVLIAFTSLAAAFCLVGTGQAAMMSAAKNIDGNLRPLLRSRILANVAASLGLLAAASYYALAPAGSWPIAAGLVAAAVLFPIYNVSDIWVSWVNGKSRFRELAIERSVAGAAGVIAIVIATLSGVTQLWIVAVLYLGLAALVNLGVLKRIFARQSNDETDDSIVKYGHHSSVAMGLSGLLAVDVIILNHVYTPQAVAIYVIALQFPNQLKAGFSVFGQALAPAIYGTDNTRAAWQAMRHRFWLLTLVAVFVGIVGYLLLPVIVTLLFGERYGEAAEYGRWLWLTTAVFGSTSYLGQALLVTKHPAYLYIPNIGYPLVLLTLYIVLVPYGVSGLILARIVAVIAMAAYFVIGFLYSLQRAPQTA
jgi:O-antigen/teichoic acid export membrane protein